jgi:hypothetical protein
VTIYLAFSNLTFLDSFVQGTDYRTQFQIGNNAFYGANYIQVMYISPLDSLALYIGALVVTCELIFSSRKFPTTFNC